MAEMLHGHIDAEKRDGTGMFEPFDGTAEEIKAQVLGFALDGWYAKWTEDKPEDAPANWTARSSQRWPINHGPKVAV